MNKALEHHYRRYRQHQLDTYGLGGEHINGVNTRKFTGGGAAYGCHALAAYNSAKGHIHLMDTLRNSPLVSRRKRK